MPFFFFQAMALISFSTVSYCRKGLKSIVALLPLLGVTFLLGFFIDFHVAVAYAYVVLNSNLVKCHDFYNVV